MRNILSRGGREVLQQFAWSNVLLAFDFDGTLAPIVSKPERAMMRKATERFLRDVAKAYPCIVISGRSHRDTMKRLRGVGLRAVIGNHGLEPWDVSSSLADVVGRWRPLLDERLAGLRGVEIEDKIFSMSIHYRRSREKKFARAAILSAARLLKGVRVVGGKQVVNLVPSGAPDKGIALLRERERLGCDTAVYIGDDKTDEDVFVLDQPGQLLTIRVGQRRTSAAAYYLENQRGIDQLLRVLLSMRRPAVATRAVRSAR